MKHYDANTEAQIIRTVLDSPDKAYILAHISEEYFYNEAVKEIYRRINVFMNLGKPIPSSQVMKNDDTLTEDARVIVANPEYYLKNMDDITAAIDLLHKYRKARILYSVVSEGVKTLQTENPNIEEVISQMEQMLQRCHTGNDASEMKHYSYDDIESLSREVVADLKEANDKDYIQTGIRKFDDQTGGIRRKNVLVMASVPGGGKSALSFHMAKHQYKQGVNVCYLSYEMDEVELRYRMLASESKVDHNEINLKRLNDKKIALIEKRFREFLKESKGNRLTIWTPQRELTVPQIAVELKPMGYDVIYIDYISLLKATNPKKQMWEILGDHARAAKLMANNLDAAVVLLAQYDDEGNKLKYSKAIQANANFVWVWDHGEKEKESGLINIRQLKARNSPLYSFYLEKDFSTFTFSDYFGPTPVDEKTAPPKKEAVKKDTTEAKKAVKKRIPSMPELRK